MSAYLQWSTAAPSTVLKLSFSPQVVPAARLKFRGRWLLVPPSKSRFQRSIHVSLINLEFLGTSFGSSSTRSLSHPSLSFSLLPPSPPISPPRLALFCLGQALCTRSLSFKMGYLEEEVKRLQGVIDSFETRIKKLEERQVGGGFKTSEEIRMLLIGPPGAGTMLPNAPLSAANQPSSRLEIGC